MQQYTNNYESVVRTQVVSGQDQKPLNLGLTDVEGAKAVARRLFDTYDRDRNGQIDNVEVVPMIVDVYKSFNRIFSPARGDIDSFYKVLDRNQDGKITYQDLEDLCIRYLTNQTPTNLRASEAPRQSGIQQTSQTVTSSYRRTQY
ncbi:unnamed protein product [Paramecium primaurelia]|uniref:EF-hand domain-containing protein n=4 Tax=Paramecium TaxID=5884 RepID=A0E1J3_PARTE|nr:uncharacterized protein GSPATT00022329001 [Paramecium tetraurelia]CAD8078073.1 unnamed protein product [Paramecium primaurelia]CAD8085438.1 unnamed protein product [Paramecium primaurelia]CAD8181638.1 unnamed protein product [Paramecium octaurelia]CAK89160.1 unnamed protein product [Paramecium tetraurelia]|eukprot:XP_001456557.1 hypothetical protein (macronuclear) [Paramecium tetraurelia strain d4-2]